MKILIFIGCITLYFVLGGIMASIVLHVNDYSFEENSTFAMLMTVVWPAAVLILFGAIGITIGDKIFDVIKHSREKHSV